MEIKSKNITPVLVILYLLPWGIQCLVNTFMPIYVASLPYGDATCVSQVIAVGAVITVISQLIWSKWADHSKNKSDILCLSLVLLGGVSLVFLKPDISKIMLMVIVILFYSAYLPHQPIIDTIVSEKYMQTNHSFGWYRSFASFGFAAMGIVYAFLPGRTANSFFIYVCIRKEFAIINNDAASGILSRFIPKRYSIDTLNFRLRMLHLKAALIVFLIMCIC